VKVAFVGMTLEDTPSVTVPSAVAGLTFAGEARTVNALVPELKAKGASAIVVLLHQGGVQTPNGTYDSCDLVQGALGKVIDGDPSKNEPPLDPAVDVVVSAHTHVAYNCRIGDRLVTSAASFGRAITQIQLEIDPLRNKVLAKFAENLAVTRDVAADPEVAGIVADYAKRAAPLADRVVGWIGGDVVAAGAATKASCETPLGDLIADGMLEATKSAGAVAAFMNPGGIRTDLVAKAAAKEAGSVTYADAFAVQPFGNQLVTLSLPGDALAAVFDEQFGASATNLLGVAGVTYAYTYDVAAKKVTVDRASIRVAGAPLDSARSYRVTVNSFLAAGGDGFSAFKKGTARVSGATDLEALTTYLGHGTKSAPLAVPAATNVTGNACK
jgi:5'-nucleotidase